MNERNQTGDRGPHAGSSSGRVKKRSWVIAGAVFVLVALILAAVIVGAVMLSNPRSGEDVAHAAALTGIRPE